VRIPELAKQVRGFAFDFGGGDLSGHKFLKKTL